MVGWGEPAHGSDGAVSVVIDRADAVVERVRGECSYKAGRIAVFLKISVLVVEITVSARGNAKGIN